MKKIDLKYLKYQIWSALGWFEGWWTNVLADAGCWAAEPVDGAIELTVVISGGSGSAAREKLTGPLGVADGWWDCGGMNSVADEWG